MNSSGSDYPNRKSLLLTKRTDIGFLRRTDPYHTALSLFCDGRSDTVIPNSHQPVTQSTARYIYFKRSDIWNRR